MSIAEIERTQAHHGKRDAYLKPRERLFLL
jgi:hypothetical protein